MLGRRAPAAGKCYVANVKRVCPRKGTRRHYCALLACHRCQLHLQGVANTNQTVPATDWYIFHTYIYLFIHFIFLHTCETRSVSIFMLQRTNRKWDRARLQPHFKLKTDEKRQKRRISTVIILNRRICSTMDIRSVLQKKASSGRSYCRARQLYQSGRF